MIDLHCHILPEIDDGAENWDGAIGMAKEAVKNGITTIVATPHHQNGVYINESELVIKLVNELNLRLQTEHIPLTIFPGNETQAYAYFINDLNNGQFLTINNNKKYVFMELPYYEVPHFIEQLIYNLQLAGYIPIIPHPERNEALKNEPMKVYRLVTAGALTQISSGSVIGTFGKKVQKFSLDLIEANLAQLIATDAHSAAGKRGFSLREAYCLLENVVGKPAVNHLQQNSELVFAGKDLYLEVPKKRRKGWR